MILHENYILQLQEIESQHQKRKTTKAEKGKKTKIFLQFFVFCRRNEGLDDIYLKPLNFYN